MKFKNKLLGLLISFCLVSTSYASPISNFLDKSMPKKAYFNCAFEKKIASKKCLVVQQSVETNTPETVAYFGKNGTYDLLTITWADGDTSQFGLMDDYEMWNLKRPNSGGYKFRTTENDELELSKGLIIDKNGKEYIRLW